jgi:hypothetical protein
MKGFIFELTDLYEKKNLPKVIYCIHALRFAFRLALVCRALIPLPVIYLPGAGWQNGSAIYWGPCNSLTINSNVHRKG